MEGKFDTRDNKFEVATRLITNRTIYKLPHIKVKYTLPHILISCRKKKLTAAVFIELSIALGTVDSSIYLKKN